MTREAALRLAQLARIAADQVQSGACDIDTALVLADIALRAAVDLRTLPAARAA